MQRPSGIALLLSRLGAHSSARFAERMAELGLTPEHVAVLRVVGTQGGLNQQALAAQLGAPPSRVVRLVDELEEEGLVERRRNLADRRNHELHTVASAEGRLANILNTVAAHDEQISRGLTMTERHTLVELLTKIAAEQGLEERPR